MLFEPIKPDHVCSNEVFDGIGCRLVGGFADFARQDNGIGERVWDTLGLEECLPEWRVRG